jgi:hypothetical protein
MQAPCIRANPGEAAMKTFLAIQVALAPFAALWLLTAFAMPATAIAAGLLTSAAWCAWRIFRHEITSLEIGGLAYFSF